MLNVGDGTARIPIRTSAWNDLAVELSTFKVKASPTPKVTSTPKSSSEPSRIQTESTTKATTITCVKGKITKQVTAVNPKCPAGYKKK
jgi:hypothetical protein